VVVDQAGVRAARETIPVLLDHDQTRIVGQGTPRIDASGIAIEGVVTGDDADAAKVVTHAKNGFRWQASIGASVTRREFLEAGKKANVNGREVVGPLIIARESVLQEVSFVAIGADARTSVAVAASNKGLNMPNTLETTTPDPSAEADRVRRLSQIALRETKAAPDVGDEIEKLLATALADDSVTPDEFRTACAQAVRRAHPVFRPYQPADGLTENALAASVMLRAGLEPLAVKAYGEQACDTARKARINNLVDLAAHALRIGGRSPGEFSGEGEMIRAAFSNASLPNILSNVVGRTLVEAYQETTNDWRAFAFVASAQDFRPQQGIRPAAIENLDSLGPAGEIKHGTLGEEATYPWQVGTYARMIGVTRETIVNDDLGFVSQLAPMLGVAAGRSLNDLIWRTIMGGETAGFFASGNGNLLTTGSALGVTGLGAAVAAMRSQRDSQGFSIAIAPQVLAVPPELEMTARALLNSSLVGRTDAEPAGNPLQGIVPTLIVEPRLSNDNFSGYSATAYYLFGGPMSRPVTVGFLRGVQTPTVEIEPQPFDRLGIQLRVVFDYGVALSDPKAALKATGAS
jgi:hypothetical protein